MHLIDMHDMHILLCMKLDQYLSTAKISDEAFGQLVGLSQSQVNRIKNGKSKPSLDMVAKIDAASRGAVSFLDFVTDRVERAA